MAIRSSSSSDHTQQSSITNSTMQTSIAIRSSSSSSDHTQHVSISNSTNTPQNTHFFDSVASTSKLVSSFRFLQWERNGVSAADFVTYRPDVWREFLWGAIAGAFGEGMMHPIDTIKTRIQSQAFISASQHQKGISQMIRAVWAADGVRGFYRGLAPGVTGSLATGATYFGVIESTKKWIEDSHPNLGGHWAHFIAGAVGDTLGSFVYVPCEVMKQRMQIQGTRASWSSVMMKDNVCVKPGQEMYGYYSGMFNAGRSILKQQGIKGLYAGYWSTLARDVPFAGLMVMFYEGLKDLTEYGKQKWSLNPNYNVNSSLEGFLFGGLAGGLSAYLTTPLDVIKTRLQVQGASSRYNGWFDAVSRVWMTEGTKGMFRGSIPRVVWYVPASAITFMAVEFLRDHFNDRSENNNIQKVASLSIDKKKSSLQEVA